MIVVIDVEMNDSFTVDRCLQFAAVGDEEAQLCEMPRRRSVENITHRSVSQPQVTSSTYNSLIDVHDRCTNNNTSCTLPLFPVSQRSFTQCRSDVRPLNIETELQSDCKQTVSQRQCLTARMTVQNAFNPHRCTGNKTITPSLRS